MNGCQEVAGGFVVASGDGTKEFEFGEEVFDQMPGLVEFPIILTLHFSVGFGRNHCSFTGILQRNQNTLVGIEGFVGEHDLRFYLRQQHIGSVQIASLTAGKMKADWIAQGVDCGVNLGAQSAFAASDGLISAPFFSAPALCW
jgi:hypothetical protein